MLASHYPLLTPKVLAIVGPTATGKSDLAMELAEQYNGEIICADSRTIYRGMNIGTAKPSDEDRLRVVHHLLDIVDPNQRFSAAEFKYTAHKSLKKIQQNHRLPIVVGGSGLYINSLIYDYKFPAGARNQVREELERLPLADLVQRLQATDSETAARIDLRNPRRVIRALETIGQPKSQSETPKSATLLVGLAMDKNVIQKRIELRTKKMLEKGLINEVESLIKQFGPDCEPFKTVGYMEVINHLSGQISLDEVERLINLHTMQLVRRQLTWFKRDANIIWSDANSAQALIKTQF